MKTEAEIRAEMNALTNLTHKKGVGMFNNAGATRCIDELGWVLGLHKEPVSKALDQSLQQGIKR